VAFDTTVRREELGLDRPWSRPIEADTISRMDTYSVTRSLVLFLLAGLCEIGGGYLVWVWLRDGRALWIGVLGGLVLFLYGVLPTLQPRDASFGRVYAAYGGVFVVLSLAWGWWFGGVRPDRDDLLGGMIALVGVGVIMYAPRS
jgi:small multidrug resistance family-3 protein